MMSIEKLLLGHKDCECGKSHVCPIKNVIIKDGAIRDTVFTAASYRSILLVADENTYKAAGMRAENVLVDKIHDKVIFDGSAILVPDEKAISEIQKHITPDIDLIIGVGSGVINDLCKYTSFAADLPYHIIATAPSMDGFASVGAALILDGMKVTLDAAVPEAIIADTRVLADAPLNMIIAGYGDIIGKYSCLNDWKLAALVRGEYICDYVVNATYREVEKVRRFINGLLSRERDAVGALMEALVSVGILMAYVGNSRPASGSEHHLSHYFEIVGIGRGEKYLSHGTDVFYSSAVTAKMREELTALCAVPEIFPHDAEQYRKNIERIYGSVALEVLSLQERLGFYKERNERLAVYRDRWQEIKQLLSEAPSFSEVSNMLREAGLSFEDFVDYYGKEKLEDAYLYAKDLKDRYTVLWLYYDLMCYPSPQ